MSETDEERGHETQVRQAQVRQLGPEAPLRPPGLRTPAAAAEELASSIGNRNFSHLVARMAEGDGILAGGRVHPDVEATIAASRGAGKPLDRALADTLSCSYGDPLDDVRVHTGPQADALARAVSARAFTVGSDIFFGGREYDPASRGGLELIAHEVAHVVQQRGAPASGPLTVSQPGDALEREADSVARSAIA